MEKSITGENLFQFKQKETVEVLSGPMFNNIVRVLLCLKILRVYPVVLLIKSRTKVKAMEK
jgi:hypothetical protein